VTLGDSALLSERANVLSKRAESRGARDVPGSRHGVAPRGARRTRRRTPDPRWPARTPRAARGRPRSWCSSSRRWTTCGDRPRLRSSARPA